MEPRITLITLSVTDLERALAFYRDGLGLPTEGIEGGEVIFFRLSGVWLALFLRDKHAADAGVPDDGHGFSGISLAHNVRSKAEVDEVLELARRAGAEITAPAQDKWWGGYGGYFRDPDGHLWEVAWNPEFPLD